MMRVAYVTSGLNMTFVINEIEAHQQAGWHILPLASCRPPHTGNFSSIMAQWIERGVHRPSCLTQIGHILREVVAHPFRFFRVCCWLAYLAICSLSEYAKALYELPAACYFAHRCREFDAQHIHVHFASRSLSLGLMLGILTNLPVSCTVHAFDIFTRNPGSLRPRLAKCRFIAAISKFNIEYLSNTCGKSVADLCHVVHCGIDTGKFRTVSRQPQPGRMLCVARLEPKKGLDVAIEACVKLRDLKVKFLLQIIGDGPEKTHLERQVHRLGLQDYVVLLGPKANDKLVPFFRKACVFLMPCVKTQDGDMDGIPVAMMEAMACQVPVVSTTISGIPELVEDGVTGRLVQEREVDALTEVLKELLGDMDEIGRLGKAAREHVLKGFSVYENAAKLRELIET